ncbi:MAG: hypothetical protein AAGB34_06560, partial [Planctomycetota bacterium]
MEFRAVLAVVLTALLCCADSANAQDPAPPSPVPPGDFVPHGDSGNANFLFTPLAPQFSEYWTGLEPQVGNIVGTPLPPLPIAASIYPAFGDEHEGEMGAAVSTLEKFWKGEYVPNSNPHQWELFTITTDQYVQNGYTNWHNYFQSALAFGGPSYPPSWPTTGPAAANFSDWVDLYAPYLSRAFFDDYGGSEGASEDATPAFGRYGFPRIGSPQHVDLPPTYPPQSTDAWSSTSPLVPASDARAVGAYLNRQSVAGRLDLITGEPLLIETDLELEFGSAMFRRIRTYSEHADHGVKKHSHDQLGFDFETWTRGWHGSGWMSSDMPLFFFDASQAGTITTGQSDQIGPVCYFVPDAHHSIPFVQQSNSTAGANVPPDYVAPDWFDAMLLYDKDTCQWGDVDPDPNLERLGWIVPPKEMKVYLHNRSVIYTIKMYYEDVDPIQHRRPDIDANGDYAPVLEINYGVPYYGLVTSIEDKVGNRVEINYVDPEKHKPYWDPRQIALIDDPTSGYEPDRLWARQRGWYKGMIDHVKLYPAGDNVAKWSIFYTYRTFYSERDRSEIFYHTIETNGSAHSDVLEEFVDYFDYLSHPPAIHSLLVYERDVDLVEVSSTRELILPCDSVTYGPAEHVAPGASPPAFSNLNIGYTSTDSDNDGDYQIGRVFAVPATGTENNQFDHQDIAIGPTGEGASTITVLPVDWTHQIRFSYADPQFYRTNSDQSTWSYTLGEFSAIEDYSLRSCGPVDIDDSYTVRDRDRAAYLLKTAVHSRAESSTQTLQDLPPKFWLYRYQDVEGSGDDAPDPYPHFMGHRYWSYGTAAIQLPRRISHRYGPETIDRIYGNRPFESASCDYNAFVNGLIGIDEDRLIEGALCYIAPPEPPGGGGGNTQPGSGEPGGTNDYGGSGPYSDPGEGPIITSSTHAVADDETSSLPIGLLADTIY